MKNSFDLLGDLGDDNKPTAAAKKKERQKQQEKAKAEKLAQQKLAAKAAAKKKKAEEAAKKKKDAEEQAAARMDALHDVLVAHQFTTKQDGKTYVRNLGTKLNWDNHIMRGHLTIDKDHLAAAADHYLEVRPTLAAVPYHVTWAEGDAIFDAGNPRWRTTTKEWDLPRKSQAGLDAREESAQLIADAAEAMAEFQS